MSVDPQWDGVNVWPMLVGSSQIAPERIFYWNLVHQRFAVRVGDWKLIRGQREGLADPELYNIAADPLEEKDVAAKNPETVQRLLAVLEEQHRLDDRSRRPDVIERFERPPRRLAVDKIGESR